MFFSVPDNGQASRCRQDPGDSSVRLGNGGEPDALSGRYNLP
jgi:hypothetical protein